MVEQSVDDERVFGLIDRIYAATLDPSLWADAFEEMALMTSGVGTIILADSSDHQSYAYRSPEIASFADSSDPALLKSSPRLDYAKKISGSSTVITDMHLLGAEQIRRSSFFNELLWPAGLGDVLARISSDSPRRAKSVISVQLALSAELPSTKSMAIFEVVSAHTARALQIFRRLSTQQADRRGLTDLLEYLECGAVIVDAHGRIVYANAVARRLDGDGITLGRRGLVAALPGEQPTLDALIRSALKPELSTDEIRPIVLSRQSAFLPLLVQAMHVSLRDQPYLQVLLADLTAALVLIVDPSQNTDRMPTSSLQLLGLTPVEAEIAALIGTGSSPEDVSTHRGIAVGTVRLHMKRIFSKLDIQRQSISHELSQHCRLPSRQFPDIHIPREKCRVRR